MQEIILQNAENLGVVLAPEAIALKEKVLANAKTITKVTDAFTLQVATDARSDIKRITKGVESTRKAIKAPILDAGREIDDLAKTFLADLLEQDARIDRIITPYEVERRRIEQEELRKRNEELERIAKEQARAEAEERRKREEAEKAILSANNKAEREAAEAKAALAEVEAAQLKRVLAARQTTVLANVPEKKPEGLALRKVPKFEILDIHAVYKCNPTLVRMEPNTSEINQRINQGMTVCDGMRIWEEHKTGARV